jgi:hypothetical protein
MRGNEGKMSLIVECIKGFSTREVLFFTSLGPAFDQSLQTFQVWYFQCIKGILPLTNVSRASCSGFDTKQQEHICIIV